jgi:hypothetical protein
MLNKWARDTVLYETKDMEEIDPLNITWATNFLANYCNGHPLKDYAPEDKSVITYFPWVDTSKCTDFSYAFAEYPHLKEVPKLDTSSAVTTSYMFLPIWEWTDVDISDSEIETIPEMDLSNVEDASYMFAHNFHNIKHFPEHFNTPKLKNA